MDPLTTDWYDGDLALVRKAASAREAALDGREQEADSRDRAADRRDDIAAMRNAVLEAREAAIQALLAAAERCDLLAEERDHRAEERDRAAESRPFTSREENDAAALDRGLLSLVTGNEDALEDRNAGSAAVQLLAHDMKSLT